MNPLQTTWLDVRKNFFPRFDRKGRWRARKGTFTSMLGEQGYCDDGQCRILVRPDLAAAHSDDLTVTLIHELIHAVLQDGSHLRRFARRLEAARTRALRLGRRELAQRIRDEIHAYRPENAERVTAGAVYTAMADLMSEHPPITFITAKKVLEQSYPRAFLNRLRRLRRVFVETRKSTSGGR